MCNGQNVELSVTGADGDLEMVHTAKKASKTVVDDGWIAGLIDSSKKKILADVTEGCTSTLIDFPT